MTDYISRRLPEPLLAGYNAFRSDRFLELEERLETFQHGQNPDTLIIACADSRVDPATIFNAIPGELFVLRNVAALVPPYQPDGGLHGVSAGIEFAVKGLNVSNVIVMGHGLCGGVDACLNASKDSPAGEFIAPWVELAAEARTRIESEHADASPEDRQRLGEYFAIRISLANLMSFPFIQERQEAGKLQLHGLWYSVYEGLLSQMNPETEEFEPL